MSLQITGANGSTGKCGYVAPGFPDTGGSSEPITVACWAWADSHGTNQNRTMSRWGSGVGTQWLLALDTVASFNIIDSGLSGHGIAGGTSMTTGKWWHLAALFDPSLTQIRLYVNGVSDGTPVSCPDRSTNAGFGIGLGCDGQNGAQFFGLNGRIAECGLWYAALTVAEILALAKGTLPPTIRPATLAGYWPLWESHATLPDLNPESSAVRHSATLISTPTTNNHPPVGPLPVLLAA
jgi:hypothetical protein